jgi:hypothetical protein
MTAPDTEYSKVTWTVGRAPNGTQDELTFQGRDGNPYGWNAIGVGGTRYDVKPPDTKSFGEKKWKVERKTDLPDTFVPRFGGYGQTYETRDEAMHAVVRDYQVVLRVSRWIHHIQQTDPPLNA